MRDLKQKMEVTLILLLANVNKLFSCLLNYKLQINK